MRTSENPVWAKFAEFLFPAIGRIGIAGGLGSLREPQPFVVLAKCSY
jgi:hypothetical protein